MGSLIEDAWRQMIESSQSNAERASEGPRDRAGVSAQPLARIRPPSIEVFERDHVLASRPVVLQGLVADWPAMRRWSLEYLQDAFASIPITTARVEAGTVAMDAVTGLVYERIRLGEFIGGLRRGARDRYLMSRLEDLPTDLRGDAPPPPYPARAPWCTAKLWISAEGTVSYMHRDLADNLHAQVRGRKRFTLVAPRHNAALYPKTLLDSIPNGCHADIERPDYARFPRLRGVETLVAELEPGDAIYVPRRWWHHVRTLEASISVNYWWARGVQRVIVQAGDYFKRLRGIAR